MPPRFLCWCRCQTLQLGIHFNLEGSADHGIDFWWPKQYLPRKNYKNIKTWEWDETLIWIVGVSKSVLQKTKSNALRFGLSCCPALQALMSTDPHERSPPTFDRLIKGSTVYAWKAQHRVTEVNKKSNMSSCFRSTIPSWMAYCRIFTKLLYLN